MKKKTEDHDIWIYSVVGKDGCELSNSYGTCLAINKEEAIGIGIKRFNKHHKGTPIFLVSAFQSIKRGVLNESNS